MVLIFNIDRQYKSATEYDMINLANPPESKCGNSQLNLIYRI